MWKENLTALKTIVRREWIRIIRIWVQTLIPPVITMALYFLIFGELVGRQIGKIGDFTYIEFIVPGLIMMSVITNSYNNVVSSFFSSKFQKNIEELLVSPTSPYTIVLGYTFGGVVRGLFVGILVTLTSLFFTNLRFQHPFIIIITVILTSILFSLGGFFNALFAKKFDDVTIIPTFILTPLTYLGGVFYSVKNLPEVWQTISYLNPILYMVNLFRYGFIGITDVNLIFSLGFILVLSILLFLLNVRLMRVGYGIRN
ncbi:MAG: ABC transporter permease [Leptospira bouyouniensis]|uniref:Transport permease protein n=1 Tax=Leptospira bouyouniensis TaxID=2484911 RepID=A0A7I0HQT7_9LEPT|nr:ABC transporter permease [Leptospira bouyouniensis]TGK48466.1 ABC transporter permease [Leptospira bouyouniensis]TGL04438.1 ABC transporter permease [Leptospira bouyouniensis]TGM80853.1 ABC transporter permease [Leptospira bouyouniensis]